MACASIFIGAPMRELNTFDLVNCVKRIPYRLRRIMKQQANKVFIAGGFVRACVAGEEISDIDVMSPTKDCAMSCALLLAKDYDNPPVIKTENAITVRVNPQPIQFIHRWTFDTPTDGIMSFDFTIARSAIWWNGTEWKSVCSDTFYEDLAAKRLVYCSPIRIEEAGGSMLRVLKFYQRGYRIPLDSLAAVVARLTNAVRMDDLPDEDKPVLREAQMAKAITGLLRDVDPLVDPDHISHLASLRDAETGMIISADATTNLFDME